MTTPTTSLQTIAAAVLPVVANTAVTYNAAKNVFLSQGWTNAAGNMYYKAMRVSPRLIVCMDLGQGYWYTFLNGIKLYVLDGTKPVLIGSRSFYCNVFNESNAKANCADMLLSYMKAQVKLRGGNPNDVALPGLCRQLAYEVHRAS